MYAGVRKDGTWVCPVTMRRGIEWGGCGCTW